MKKYLVVFLLLFLFSAKNASATTYYASPSGGGAASCVDSGANVCTLQRAITVAAGGTNTIECANGSYTAATSFVFNATNTGANLTIQKAVGATVTASNSNVTAVFDIQATMVSGTITFSGIDISETDTDYSIRNSAPEVNVVYTGGSNTNSDATAGVGLYAPIDTTNLITLYNGQDTVTNLRTGATTNVKIAQKIVVGGSNITVNRASFNLQRRCGNKSGECNQYVSGESWDYRNSETLTVTIETDTAGAPSGTPVTNGTSATVLAYNVPYKSSEWQSFSFASNVTLTAATTYWVVLQGTYTASTTNYIAAALDTSNGYASGDSATYDGTTWTGAAAGSDLLFTVDRAHTRNITVTSSTFNTRSSPIQVSWADTTTITSNTLTSTAGGIVSLTANNQWTTSDVQHKKVLIQNNTTSSTTSLSQFVVVGVNTYAQTYTETLMVIGNTSTVDYIMQPNQYLRKLFIKDNNFTVGSSGNCPLQLGKEVTGTDPQEINPNGFDQVIIESNTFYYSSSTHNHIMLFAIGSEDGVLIDNTIRVNYGSGTSSGGWGIIIKAARWTIIGNRFYGAGPSVYLTSNHNRVLYNTFESFDATGSNSSILFRAHQDNIYGSNHGIPKFNFIENNIFVSNGSGFAAITHCDSANCSGTNTLGTNRTEQYWSNRIDYNAYFARSGTNTAQIGAYPNFENITLAEGLSNMISAWQSTNITDKTSLAYFNDANSTFSDPGLIDPPNGNFTMTNGSLKKAGSIATTAIGGSQSSGGRRWVAKNK